MAPKKRKTKGRGRTSTRTALPGFDPSTSAFVLKDSEERWFVEVILAARRCRTPRSSQTEYKPMHDGGRWEYLVKWAGFSEDDNTWEPATSLLSCARLVHSFWSRFPIHTDGHETYFCKGDKAGLLLTPPSDWIEREKAIFQTLANEQDVAKQNADPLNHAREAILELLPRHLFQTPISDLDSASAVGGPSTTTHEPNAAFDGLPLPNANNYLRRSPTQVRQHARLYGHHWQQNPDQHALRVDPEGDFDSKLGDFGALTLGIDDGVLEGAARLGGHDVAPKLSPTEAKMPQPQPLVAQPSHTPPMLPIHDPVDDGDKTMLDASASQSQSQSQPEGDRITTDDGDDIPPPNTSVSSITPSTAANALPVATAKPTQRPHRSESTTTSAGGNVVDIDVPCTAMEWGQVCSLLLESGSERRVQNAEQAEAVGAGVRAAHDDGDHDVSEPPRARDPAVTLPKSILVASSSPMSPETMSPILFGQPHRLLLPQPQPVPQPQPNLQTQTQVPALQIPIHDVVEQPRPSNAMLPPPSEPVPPSPNPQHNIDIEVDKRDEGQVARELVPSADEASPTPSPSTEPALPLPVLVEDEQAQAQVCMTEDLLVSPQQKDVTANEIVVESDETRLQHPVVLGHDDDEDTQLEQTRSRGAEESFPSRDKTPTPPASVGPPSMPTPTPTSMPMVTSTTDEATADNVAEQEDEQDVAMMSTMGGEEEEEEAVKLESMEGMVEDEGQLDEHDELQDHSSDDQNVDDDDTMVVDQPQVDAAITANAPQPSAAPVVPTSNTNSVPIPSPFPSYPKPSTTPRDISLPPITTFSRPSYFASSLSSPSNSSSSPISPVSLSSLPLPLSPTARTVPSTSESLSLPPTLLPSPHVSQKRKREHVPVPAPLDPTREPRRPKAPRTGSRIKLLDSSVGASLPGARGRTDVVSVAGNARKRMIGERAYASGLLLTERGERDVEMLVGGVDDGRVGDVAEQQQQPLPQPTTPTTPKAPVSSIWSPSTDDWSNWSTPYPLAEPRNIPAATGTGRHAEMDVDAEPRFEMHSGSWSFYASTSPTSTSIFKSGSWIPSQTAGFGFARPKAQTQAEPRRPEARQGFHVAGGNNVPLGWSSVSSARPSSSSSSGWSSTEAAKKDWFARGTTNKDRNSTTNDHNHTPASHTTRKDAHWPSLSSFAETSRNAMPTVTSSTHTTTTRTTNASTFRWPSLSEFV